MVKIEIPSSKGHTTQSMDVPQAKAYIEDKLQKGWIAAVNGKQVQAGGVAENDTVKMYPPIQGG